MIKKVKISDLKVDEKMAKKFSKEIYRSQLYRQSYIFKAPIIVDDSLNVLCGSHRVVALRKIKYEGEINVIVATDEYIKRIQK